MEEMTNTMNTSFEDLTSEVETIKDILDTQQQEQQEKEEQQKEQQEQEEQQQQEEQEQQEQQQQEEQQKQEEQQQQETEALIAIDNHLENITLLNSCQCLFDGVVFGALLACILWGRLKND